eukprot:GHVS01073198.1.p2 GENE.GHVS01073198.1~~GHVS01073198.1.p2  ORF type:complete len:116 (-),score=19.61 GHVS01073198.1:187-534(-)
MAWVVCVGETMPRHIQLSVIKNNSAMTSELDTTEVPVLLDCKREDIGSTAAAYAESMFAVYRADAVTVSPYIGRESIRPFLLSVVAAMCDSMRDEGCIGLVVGPTESTKVCARRR